MYNMFITYLLRYVKLIREGVKICNLKILKRNKRGVCEVRSV